MSGYVLADGSKQCPWRAWRSSLWRGPHGGEPHPRVDLRVAFSQKTATGKGILPLSSWLSLEADSFPIESPDENPAWPTSWLQPLRPSRESACSMPGSLSHGKCQVINMHVVLSCWLCGNLFWCPNQSCTFSALAHVDIASVQPYLYQNGNGSF